MTNDFNIIKEKLKEFNKERDWDQYLNPKDILVALMSEIGELADLYKWLDKEEMAKVHKDPVAHAAISEEIADIFSYVLTLAEKAQVDILDTLDKKIEKNRARYPLDKSKGVHSNPLEGFKAGKNQKS